MPMAVQKIGNGKGLHAMNIYKFPIRVTDVQAVRMSAGAQILTVQVQHGQPCIWAHLDPDQPPTTRTIEMFGTGHPIEPAPRQYIGTVQLQGGGLVFHVFERLDATANLLADEQQASMEYEP
jgi:hypothetical protein